MLIDRYTKIVLTVVAVSLIALAANTALPLREVAMIFRPSDAAAQSECPAVAKGTIPKDYKLVGSWMPMNVPQPDPKLVFETTDAYWFVSAEWYYKNLEPGKPECVLLKVKKR